MRPLSSVCVTIILSSGHFVFGQPAQVATVARRALDDSHHAVIAAAAAAVAALVGASDQGVVAAQEGADAHPSTGEPLPALCKRNCS